MRLLDVETRRLEEFFGDDIPEYAILSHTWGKDEVTFQDLDRPEHTSKLGYAKIDGCCRMIKRFRREFYEIRADGTLDEPCSKYLWIDTCCIDKSSSAELSEAINSMFNYYRKSSICYVYLPDVPSTRDLKVREKAIRQSRWFTRGWTLQELLAPTDILFLDSKWKRVGYIRRGLSKFLDPHSLVSRLDQLVQEITGIHQQSWTDADLAQKLSWASKRQTTRKEDIAYSLLGLLGVNMPLLYGEGDRAFQRLLQEVIKSSNDHSVLAAGFQVSMSRFDSALPSSPHEYAGCTMGFDSIAIPGKSRSLHFTMTNAGLDIELPILALSPNDGIVLALLNCRPRGMAGHVLGLPLVSSTGFPTGWSYSRVPYNPPILGSAKIAARAERRQIYITNSFAEKRDMNDASVCILTCIVINCSGSFLSSHKLGSSLDHDIGLREPFYNKFDDSVRMSMARDRSDALLHFTSNASNGPNYAVVLDKAELEAWVFKTSSNSVLDFLYRLNSLDFNPDRNTMVDKMKGKEKGRLACITDFWRRISTNNGIRAASTSARALHDSDFCPVKSITVRDPFKRDKAWKVSYMGQLRDEVEAR